MFKEPMQCSLDSESAYQETHRTAKEQCVVCRELLGYDVPLLAYWLDASGGVVSYRIIHEHCRPGYENASVPEFKE